MPADDIRPRGVTSLLGRRWKEVSIQDYRSANSRQLRIITKGYITLHAIAAVVPCKCESKAKTCESRYRANWDVQCMINRSLTLLLQHRVQEAGYFHAFVADQA